MALQQDLALYPNARLVQIHVDRMVLSYTAQAFQATEHASFSHPRSLIDDFAVAEKLLLGLMKQTQTSIFQFAPYLFIQVMERTEAGLTFVEIRALQELGFNSGARFIAIYDETGKLISPNVLPKPVNFKYWGIWKGTKLAFIALLTGFAIFTLFLK